MFLGPCYMCCKYDEPCIHATIGGGCCVPSTCRHEPREKTSVRPTLPCLPGDTVYRLVSWGKGKRRCREVRERIVSSVEYNGEVWIIHSTGDDVLGKSVFLTIDDANAALCGGVK